MALRTSLLTDLPDEILLEFFWRLDPCDLSRLTKFKRFRDSATEVLYRKDVLMAQDAAERNIDKSFYLSTSSLENYENGGSSAIFWGVLRDSISTIKLSLAYGGHSVIDQKRRNMDSRGNEKAEPALAMAARLGRRDAVALLLENGADIEALTYSLDRFHPPQQWTPLRAAIHASKEDMALLLAQRGASQNVLFLLRKVGNRGVVDLQSTALVVSIREKLPRVTHELLNSIGGDIDVQNYQGLTALHLAMDAQYDESIPRQLLNAGANPNVVTGNGTTPLFLLCSAPWRDISCKTRFESLVKAGADVNVRNQRGQTPLAIAASQAQLSTITSLVEHGADPLIGEESNEGPWQLLSSTSVGHDSDNVIKCLAKLIDAGITINVARLGTFILNQADIKIINFIYDQLPKEIKVDEWLDIYQHSAFLRLEDSRIHEHLRWLWCHHPPPTDEEYEDEKSEQKWKEIIINMLSSRAVRDDEIVNRLCNCLDITLRNAQGRDSLMILLQNRNFEVATSYKSAEILLERGTDLRAQDEDGKTCLHILVENEMITTQEFRDLTILLTQKGADVNIQDNKGNTVLHHFIDTQPEDTSSSKLLALLEAGAMLSITNKDDQTPRNLFEAVHEENEALLDLLIEWETMSKLENHHI
jgi:ankyrin repeat protein